MQEKDFIRKGLGYLKCYVHTRHDVPLVQIKMNRLTKHVSVDGQIMIRTCANGSLKYHKYQDIEADVEATMEKWLPKKLVATIVSSRIVGTWRRMEGMTTCSQDATNTHTMNKKTEGWREKVGADRVSNTLMVTFQCACIVKTKMLNRKRRRLKERVEMAEADNVIVTLKVTCQCVYERNKCEENEARSKIKR